LQDWGDAGIHLYLHLPAIHAYAYSYSDTYGQTNAHSETPHDTEAAPESAAKAERSEPMIR